MGINIIELVFFLLNFLKASKSKQCLRNVMGREVCLQSIFISFSIRSISCSKHLIRKVKIAFYLITLLKSFKPFLELPQIIEAAAEKDSNL